MESAGLCWKIASLSLTCAGLSIRHQDTAESCHRGLYKGFANEAIHLRHTNAFTCTERQRRTNGTNSSQSIHDNSLESVRCTKRNNCVDNNDNNNNNNNNNNFYPAGLRHLRVVFSRVLQINPHLIIKKKPTSRSLKINNLAHKYLATHIA